MAIPTYDALMLPVLRACAEKEWHMRDLVVHIADLLSLTPEERAQEIPSGPTKLIANRVHWAKTYLKKSGLLEQQKRGYVRITQRGRDVLTTDPVKIDAATLQQFPEFQSFVSGMKQEAPEASQLATLPSAVSEPSATPEEQIAAASIALNSTLRDALIARIIEGSPEFFEKLIIDLLLAMGYGGTRSDAGEHLGKTGDGGIDGVIREDQLGLDRIYLQAKRYQPGNTVGSEAVQAFLGALLGKGAQKGVFITTSTFSKAAYQVANQSGAMRLVLVDGNALTDLMLRFNVGVRVAQSIEIKRVDAEYFDGDQAE